MTSGDRPAITRGRADLHVHPHGDRKRPHDGAGVLARLATIDVDVVALTDHDLVGTGALMAQRLRDSGVRVELVIGAEISSIEGHVLGLWLRHDIPRDRPLAETIARIHDQGGAAIVAHPLLPTRISAPGAVIRGLADGPALTRPDAIEGHNPLAAWIPGYRTRLARLASRTGLPMVGGSDAHHPEHIGLAWTVFDGTGAADLRAAIGAGSSSAHGRDHAAGYVVRGVLDQLRLLRPRV